MSNELNFNKKYKLEMHEEKHICFLKKLLKFPDGTLFHLKCLSSKIARFEPHQKAPSPKINTIY
jgi:hypothetical protein